MKRSILVLGLLIAVLLPMPPAFAFAQERNNPSSAAKTAERECYEKSMEEPWGSWERIWTT